MKKIFSIVFVLVLVVGLGLVTAVPILADVSPGWMDIDQVGAGAAHTLGVKDDGTVVAVGDNGDGQCEIGGWTNIKQVAAGYAHTAGAKNDGTVVAVGDNEYGQCEVGNWTDIVQVAAGARHTVGVKDDDTAIAVGRNDNGQCNVGGWMNISQVAAGGFHTVGLRSDGTVAAVGSNGDGQCNVGGWTNITQVAAGDSHTVGLRSDGTVVAIGYNDYGQCSVGGWTNITQVAAGGAHTVGLRSDGTVIAVGNNGDEQCNVTGWTDITQVAAGRDHTVGIRSGGTVVAVGLNDYGQCGHIVTKTVTNDTVDAIDEADTEVEVHGTATVTIFRYASNPHPGAPVDEALASLDFVALSDGFEPMNIYPDVRAINITPGTEIEIRLYYTAAEVQGFNETSVRLFWHNGAAWVQCSPTSGDSGVNTSHVTIDNHEYSGYMWARIRESGTTPSLPLQGDEFGGYGHPSPTDGICFIATAAYGTDTARQLDILREFRDTVLLPNSLGAKLVSFYYKTSPPIASFISQHESLRTVVRMGLVDPVVRILTWTRALWSGRGS